MCSLRAVCVVLHRVLAFPCRALFCASHMDDDRYFFSDETWTDSRNIEDGETRTREVMRDETFTTRFRESGQNPVHASLALHKLRGVKTVGESDRQPWFQHEGPL